MIKGLAYALRTYTVKKKLNIVVRLRGPSCCGNLDIYIYHMPVKGKNMSKIAKNPHRIPVLMIFWP